MNKLLIAGTNSGVGKTTIALGIMAALEKRGKNVQPFKIGPDYIDTSYQTYITGNVSSNLDSFMLDKEQVKYIFKKSSENKDISIIEGVMGLYDGIGTDLDNCSTASVSKILKAPVILVLNAKAMATSAAAIVMGYQQFDKNVEIVGVILNNVRTESHFNLIKKSVEKYCKVEVLGYLPPSENINIKSRHLGLIPSCEMKNLDDKKNNLIELVEKYIDIDRLIQLSECESIESTFALNMFLEDEFIKSLAKGKKIAIAKDEAFNFYYRENIELLENIGLEIEYFSPINDKQLPKCDILYLGGGFPELFAKQLENNISMRQSILKAHNENLPIYAECGGLMYLGRKIKNKDKSEYNMVGIFDGESCMTKSLKNFGYCKVESMENTVVFNVGEKMSGHEFHHSVFETNEKEVLSIIKEIDGEVVKIWTGGYSKKNTFASYLHVHFYNNLNVIVNLLRHADENDLEKGKENV